MPEQYPKGNEEIYMRKSRGSPRPHPPAAYIGERPSDPTQSAVN